MTLSDDDDDELERRVSSSSSCSSSLSSSSSSSPVVLTPARGGRKKSRSSSKRRPLVILFGGLGARAQDLSKYSEAWQVRGRERKGRKREEEREREENRKVFFQLFSSFFFPLNYFFAVQKNIFSLLRPSDTTPSRPGPPSPPSSCLLWGPARPTPCSPWPERPFCRREEKERESEK